MGCIAWLDRARGFRATGPSNGSPNENAGTDCVRDARDGNEPRETEEQPIAPIDASLIAKRTLRVVFPADVHHESGNREANHAEDGEDDETSASADAVISRERHKFNGFPI